MRLSLALCCAAMLATGSPAPAAGPEPATLQTVDGEITHEVRAIVDDGTELSVQLSDGRRLRATDVGEIRWRRQGSAPIGAAGARVFLRNGDALGGSVTGGDGELVQVQHPLLGALALPLDRIAALAYSADAAELDRFRREIVATEPQTDVVVLRSWTRRPGVLETIDEKGVTGDWEGLGVATFTPENALGVRLAPLGPVRGEIGKTTVRLELVDGSIVTGRLLELDGDALRFVPWASGKPLAIPVAYVAAIRFPASRFQYLSDLEPQEVEQRSEVISVPFPPQRDAAVLGGPLRVGGKLYRKGLGVHAFTRLRYELAGRYDRLRATIGLDDTAREARTVTGTVRFQVLADGKPLLGEKGLLLTSEDPPRTITLDLRGARQLDLIADFGPSGDTLARGAWADAVLVRSREGD